MMPINIHLKKELLETCINVQKSRVDNARKAMQDAQDAANQEEKSTAGDKYDTSRAMSQNLRDMNARQLNEAQKELALLEQINGEQVFSLVKQGAIVRTEEATFFLAGSIGQVRHREENYFVISIISPIGQQMANKREGESFIFKGKPVKILQVF